MPAIIALVVAAIVAVAMGARRLFGSVLQYSDTTDPAVMRFCRPAAVVEWVRSRVCGLRLGV